MSIYDNTKTGYIESLIKAKAEAARYHRDLESRRVPKDPSKMDLSDSSIEELTMFRWERKKTRSYSVTY